MRELFGRLWMFWWQIAALALVVGLMWFFANAHLSMWRLASARYAAKPRSARIASKLETAVIAARGSLRPNPLGAPYRRYPIMLEIHDDGLALAVVPPFHLMCPPLFLPFDEMEVQRTDWALWSEPFAIRMRRLPDLDIIIGRDTVRWLRDYIDRSPFGLGV